MNLLYNPGWRIAWSVGSAVVLVSFVAADWVWRSGSQSFLAPSAAALWLSVALGLALGGMTALWERYLFLNQRDYLLAFLRASLWERLSWHHLKSNLLLNGWLILSLLALLGGCFVSGVFVLPPLLAVNAVTYAFNGRLAGQFNEELRQQAA